MAETVIPTHPQFLSLYILEDISYEFNGFSSKCDEGKTNDVLLINQWDQTEDSFMNVSFDTKALLGAAGFISLVTGSVFKCIMYAYVVSTNKENRGWMHRPINVLILASSVIHHGTHIWMWSWYILQNIILQTSLSDALGFHWCIIMQMVAGYGMCYLTVGGFGISIYRLLLIKREHWVKYVIGQELLLAIILSMNFILCWIIVLMYSWEGNLSRPTLNTTLNACQEVSLDHAQILIDYGISRGEPLITTSYLQAIAVAICIVIQTFEFTTYIYFFYYRYKHDNGKVAKLLSSDVIRDRNIKNMQTFLGQFYGFMTEYAFLTFFFVVIVFTNETTYSIRSYANMVKFMDFGILSAVEYFTSPVLREFMR